MRARFNLRIEVCKSLITSQDSKLGDSTEEPEDGRFCRAMNLCGYFCDAFRASANRWRFRVVQNEFGGGSGKNSELS